MRNFTDGKSDGLMLLYVKDGKAYPVGVKQDEMELLDVMIGGIVTSAYPVYSTCIGDIQVMTKEAGK